MRFKIKSTEIEISFTFFAVYFIFLGYGKGEIFVYSLVASLIHECVHIGLILLFGAHISAVSLTAAGGNIVRKRGEPVSSFKEGLISISAPVFNICLGFVFLCFNKNSMFATVNIMLGCFNALPFFSLDGGRALYYFLSPFFTENALQKILTVSSGIVAVCFAFLSVYVFFYHNRNYLLVFMSLFMVISLVVKEYKDIKNEKL